MLDHYTIFGIISLINCLTCVIIGIFLLIKNARNPINLSYCIFDFCIAFYAFFYFLWQSSSDPDTGILFFKYCILGVVLINSAFFHFTFIILKLERSWGWQVWLVHLVNTIAGYGALFLFYADWKIKYSYGLWPIPSMAFNIYVIWWFLQVFYCFNLIYAKGILKTNGRQKKQYQWIFWATLIAYAGGATNWLVWYDINFPPYLNSGIAIYTLVLAYAIFRHQLLDIEVIIKKSLVFAGLFAMVIGVVGLVTSFLRTFVARFVGYNEMVSTAASVFVVLLLFDPARKLLVNLTDKYLFQKKEDIKVILNRLASNIITILDLNKVGETVLVTLEESLRLESAAIILKEEKSDTAYQLLNAYEVPNAKSVYQADDPLIAWMKQSLQILNIEQQEVRQKLSAPVLAQMADLKAVVCMPLVLHSELIGLLTFGKKKSDEEFSQDELDYFPTVASQVAIALSNARLYDILRKSQIDFAQQAKMAAIGTLSAGISHEIKNPLNHIKVGIGMLKMNKKHGLLDKMDRPAFEQEIFSTLDIMEDNVRRANEVIERLSSFAKKPKELKMEAIDLKKAVENSLSFLDSEFKYCNIMIQTDFPEKYPLVKADQHAMEDIFLNLLVNARHAIGQQGSIQITGRAEGGRFVVSIKDSGCGIPRENLEKIFDPFFTTKDVSRNPDKNAVKGSGLGLFIVREFIQRFGGTIHAESETGKGTAFVISFPETSWEK